MNFEPIPGTTVIGLGHKARHGKDTAAEAIIAAEPGAKRYAFSDDLYAITRALYGMTTKDAPLLQKVGVFYRDAVDPDIWVKCVYAKLLLDRPRVAIITDVRFPNEFNFVKQLGGTTCRVTRLNHDGTPFVDPSRPATHISETANDDMPWDYVLEAYSGNVEGVRLGARQLAWGIISRAEKVAA